MAAKKKSRSFAAEARRLIKRYEPRLGPTGTEKSDPMAARAFKLEMDRLIEAQEQQKALKAQMEQPATQPQMKMGGGLPQYAIGGGLAFNTAMNQQNLMANYFKPKLPTDAFDADTERFAELNTYDSQLPFQRNVPTGYATTVPSSNKYSTEKNAPRDPKNGGNLINGIPNEALIGMGSQALGTIAQGLLTKKPKDINATPVNVPDYVPVQNEEAIRQAKLAYAGQQTGARYLSPSQYMAQMNALAAGEAGTTAGIAEQTANANAQGMNAYNMQKAEFEGDYRRQQLMADEYNSQNQIGYNAMLAGIPAALGQQVAGGLKDVLAYKQQAATIPWLGTNNYQAVLDSRGNPVRIVVADTNKQLGTYFKDGKKVWFQGDPNNTIDKATFDNLLNSK